MPQCLFERSTGIFVGGASYDTPSFNPATHVLLVLLSYPNPRTQRWNGAVGVRDASPAEMAAYDDRIKELLALDNVDSAHIKAVTRAVLDEIDFRHPSQTVDRGSFRLRALNYLKALL